MPLASHTRLGPYEITDVLGAGETGEVYRATDIRLNRTVAIKLLKGPDVNRLEREARVIAAVNNPYICAIYDIGSDYIVMEYIEGTPIKGPLPAKEFLRLATQIASALEAAHLQGIIHRDLKPANILVSRGNVKLLDFGHAKHLSSGARDPESTGTVLGTAAYMSPEQAQGRDADPRSDIFSFGLVLFEMLSGRRAFEGDTVLDMLNAVVRSEPRPLETSPELQRIVMRCLHKDPATRFQSMREVKEALEQISIRTQDEQPSIVVLPFENLSGDKENDYFTAGLTEEIINELAQIPGLRVTARTSAFVFLRKQMDVRKIAEMLDVQTLLEGSVRESKDRLRITAQLVSATDGCHLWSQSYDRQKADVFEIQDDIAGSIAKALQLRLYHRSTVSIDAYEAYLKARYYMWKLTPESLAKSRECYERAIALDPQFALAHSGYAEYMLVRAIVGIAPASEAMPAARASARKALDITPSLPEAQAVIATVATLYDFDRRESERRFELATTREAVSSVVRICYAYYYLLPRGHGHQAVNELERGLREDPLNPTLHYLLGVCLFETDREAQALQEFREALEIDQGFIWAMVMLAMDYWSRGMNAEALAWAERSYSTMPWLSRNVGLYAGMLARTGETRRAKRMLEQLGDGDSYGSPYGYTIFYSLLNELDDALRWFERLIQQRYVSGAFQLLHSPLGRLLASSPRWPALVKTLNLHHTILPMLDKSAA